MSSSRPYKSRFVRAVVRQTQRWLERGQTAVRRLQVATAWSAQILLYPVYALFQSSRLLGLTIERQQRQSPQFTAAPPDEIPLEPAIAELTAETPILNLLQEISALVPADVAVWIQPPPKSIRAIACLIETQSLVLVTNQNQILDVFTPDQQYWLRQRLIYEIASYDRQRRIWNLPQQRVRRFLQGVRSRLLAPARSTPLAQLHSSGELSIDLPVRQSLWAVRQLLADSDLALPQLSSATDRVKSPLPSAPPIYIRGIASLLSDRSLVLVNHHNDLLDLLTPDQQALIQQRLIRTIADYWRDRRLCGQPLLPPLRPPGADSRMLPPVRVLRWLMTWMQFGSVARSTNLFQEATLVACPLPESSTSIASAPLTLSPKTQRQWQPAPLSLPATRSTSTPMRSQMRPDPKSTLAIAETITVPPAALPANSAIVTRPQLPQSPIDYIDTHVTLVRYEQSWLERVMHWLDRCFVWVEGTIAFFWHTLTGRK